MANFSSSSVGSGMGTFRGMMCCFISDWPSTLSILPILMPYPAVDLKLASASYGDKNNPSKRSKKKESPKYSESLIRDLIRIIHFSPKTDYWRKKKKKKADTAVVPKCHLPLITRLSWQCLTLVSFLKVRVQLLHLPESSLCLAWPIHYLQRIFPNDR